MRTWRNWQTRRFQIPVGNRVGSNPFVLTNEKRAPKRCSFFVGMNNENMKGFEGGSRFAGAKRFALRSLDNDKLDGKGRR